MRTGRSQKSEARSAEVRRSDPNPAVGRTLACTRINAGVDQAARRDPRRADKAGRGFPCSAPTPRRNCSRVSTRTTSRASMRALALGPNKGDRTPHELADLLEAWPLVDPAKFDTGAPEVRRRRARHRRGRGGRVRRAGRGRARARRCSSSPSCASATPTR